MLQNFNQYENENGNEYVDITAMLTHVVGYHGDLNGVSGTDPLVWKGGAPVSKSDRLSA